MNKKLLKLLKSNINPSAKSYSDYQTEIYENISNLLYKYPSEKIADITNNILENFQLDLKDQRGFNLCNKILQGCLISGNYSQALLMSNKILGSLENSSTNLW